MPADPTRIQEVFLAAAALTDPAARSAYLDGACAGDPTLRARVEALLRAHDQPGSLLDAPAGADEPTRTDGVDVHDDGEALGILAPPQRPGSLGRLGHYEVLEVLGRGGFGIVFRAFDDVLQRVVAVKVLAPSLAVTSPARKRFLREARASAPIQDENVVRVHEVGEQPLPYLVMEFVPGETLQQTLDRIGPLEVADVLRIGRQVALGLAAAHERGLIHRDIKPSNILIDGGPERHAKITDFGLARAADDASLTRSGVVAGTPMYMAPEQARGESLDHRADLFSLGSVLYTMLTGRPPFRAETTLAVLKRVAEDTPRPIREVIPEVPAWLCRIVEKLHAKDPAARYQTAREVVDVLGDCEAQLKAHGGLKDASRIPSGRPAARRRPRVRTLLIAAAGLLPVLAGVYVLGVDNIGRYFANRAFITVEPRDSHIDKIIIWDRGQEAATFTGTGFSFPATPGRYDVEIFPQSGYRVIVESRTHGLGARWTGGVFESTLVKDVPVSRGDEVRLVIRTEKLRPAEGEQKTKATPFVLLARGGKPERTFAGLGEAVTASESGDVLEVRGDGPFDSGPIVIEGKALTIRAAGGRRPVLRLNKDDAAGRFHFIRTDSPLVLEGLELHRVSSKEWIDSHSDRIVWCENAPFHAANCRFFIQPGLVCVVGQYAPACRLTNCEFLGGRASAFDWNCPRHGSLVVENCLVLTATGVGVHGCDYCRDVSVRLVRNTWCGLDPVQFMLDSVGDQPDRTYRVEASENVFHYRTAVLHLVQTKNYLAREKPLDAPQAEALLSRLVGWGGRHNAYSPGSNFLAVSLAWEKFLPTSVGKGLPEWQKFWGGAEKDSVQGPIQFREANVPTQAERAPLQLTPAQLRLHPAGVGAGETEGGKDLGADVDLVGPGAAYERWKKTPAYQDWLKEIEQAVADPPPMRP